jgi:hypothetical protein
MNRIAVRMAAISLAMVVAGAGLAQTPVGTAFTYQGQLKLNGSPVGGTADFIFKLYDASIAGTQVGADFPAPNVTVSAGTFTTRLDFGTSPFAGAARWLEIWVRSPAGSGTYTQLTPRQELTASPYALYSAAPWGSCENGISYCAGAVGMGTTTPGARLDVNGDIIAGGRGEEWLFHTRSQTGGDFLQITDRDESGAWKWGQGLTIGENGNVGIGTTNPLSKLDVRAGTAWADMLSIGSWGGNPTYYPGLIIGYTDGGAATVEQYTSRWGARWLWEHGSAEGWVTQMLLESNNDLFLYDGADRPIRLSPTGPSYITQSLGIGTESPLVKLDVNGGIRASGGVPGAGGVNNVGYAFSSPGDADSGMFSTGDGQLSFYTNSGERVRIAPSGNVGIGTAAPSRKLDVIGDAYLQGVGGWNSTGDRAYLYLGDTNNYIAGEWGQGLRFGTYEHPDALSIEQIEGDVKVANSIDVVGHVGIGNPTTTDRPLCVRAASAGWPEWIGLYDPNGTPTWHFNNLGGGFNLAETSVADARIYVAKGGNVGIHTSNPTAPLTVQGNVQVRGAGGQTIIELGEGLDYAEGFDIAQNKYAAPGTVVVIDADNPGELTTSTTPYDSRVAGIVAGAKGLGSAVRLAADRFDCQVALAGRVYCNVDATYGAIQPGDLLTTSPTPGHAMKVTDSQRATGAVLGKAMQALPRGEKGQILVLVTLQ